MTKHLDWKPACMPWPVSPRHAPSLGDYPPLRDSSDTAPRLTHWSVPPAQLRPSAPGHTAGYLLDTSAWLVHRHLKPDQANNELLSPVSMTTV